MSYVFNNAVFSASCVRDLGLVMTTTRKIEHYEMYMPQHLPKVSPWNISLDTLTPLGFGPRKWDSASGCLFSVRKHVVQVSKMDTFFAVVFRFLVLATLFWCFRVRKPPITAQIHTPSCPPSYALSLTSNVPKFLHSQSKHQLARMKI